MTRFCLLFFQMLVFVQADGQFFDNFSNGNFTDEPAWETEVSNFIVNENFQLQSANITANALFTITTNSPLTSNTQWEFWTKLDFNTSSANYVDVWLVSSGTDLNATANEGYFVRMGNTDDNICLYKKKGGQTERMIEGVKGILNSSSSTIKIKIIRTSENKWILLRDLTGSGISYRSEGEANDTEILPSSYFGISIKQSTPSFFQKHFFDDFAVEPYQGNTTELNVAEVSAVNSTTVKITFGQPLNIGAAENISGYHVSKIGNPATAVVDSINGSIVWLTFGQPFTPNEKNTIIIAGVADVFGNQLNNAVVDFYYYRAGRYDVVIDEIFADPSPQIGLPGQKFIELKNVAAFPVDLHNWQVRSGGNVAVLPRAELLPDSFLIVTTSAGLNNYIPFGNTIAVPNFPALNISGAEISLYDNEGNAIHAVRYDQETYGNPLKKDGGFSLEMVNTHNGCSDATNWVASKDPSGGTPGRRNSVDSRESSGREISVVNAWLEKPDRLVLKMSKTVDSASSVQKANYAISDGLQIKQIESASPFFNLIKIVLTEPVVSNKIYSIKVNNLYDCTASKIGSKNAAQFGISETPVEKDIVINEILSEPRTVDAEYLELYNCSERIFDASQLFIANRNTAGLPSSITQISSEPRLLFPGAFLLITREPEATIRDYPFADASAILKMNSLPSIPNDKGVVLILDRQGNIIDEISYDKNWHFPLIKDKKGVSLERISYNGPSDKTNFHSASREMNYGTPGTKNSQNKSDDTGAVNFTISPEIFSPDNDGRDDFLTIYYNFAAPGYITNIKIFDASGRLVRYLEKNAISGVSGYYRWDGLDDKNQKLAQGIYIIYFESFNEAGQKIIHKKAVVLARM